MGIDGNHVAPSSARFDQGRWVESSARVIPEEPPLRLKDYLELVRNRKTLISACVAIPLVFCIVAIVNMTPVYTARSTIEMQDARPKVLEMQDLNVQSEVSETHDFYKTEYDVLSSRSLAAQVITDLDLQHNPFFKRKTALNVVREPVFTGYDSLGGLHPERSKLSTEVGVPAVVIDAYLKRLSIEPKMGTRLVSVGFTSPDRALSAQVANAHVRAYIQRGIQLNVQGSKAIEDYLQTNLVELKDRVEKSEAALNEYRRERGIVAFASENTGYILMKRLNELNTELTKIQARRIELAAEYELIRRRNFDSLAEVQQSLLIQNLKEQVSTLDGEHAKLASRFYPGYHKLDDAKVKLHEAAQLLKRNIAQIVQSVTADYQTTVLEEASVNKAIEETKQQALRLKDDSLQDGVLVRDLGSKQKLYETVLKRIQEIGVTTTVPTSNVSVIDEAGPPRYASSPKVLEDLLLSGFLGLAVGLGAAFLSDFLDDRLKTKEQATRYLNLPVVAMVPDFNKAKQLGWGYGNRLAVTSGIASRKGAPQSKELMTGRGPTSVSAEMYRSIRTAVLFSRAGAAPKSILVTSACSGDGKTVTAVNVALAFAQTGQTLLIDADLRRGRCHEILDISNHIGLTEILVGRRKFEDVVHSTPIPGLSLLSPGSQPPDPAGLLGSTVMRDLLQSLGEEYQHIILDSAPLVVSDSIGLAAIVDGAIVVAGAQTPKQMVRDCCSRLSAARARLLGIIMNQVDPSVLRHGYYGYSYNQYTEQFPRASEYDQDVADHAL